LEVLKVKAAKIIASILILLSIPARARQVELKIDQIPVKITHESYGFGTRFVFIVLPIQYYSKENLERLWRYYCEKYPDKKDKLDLRVYVERESAKTESTTDGSFDANFSRQGEGAAASGGDNEFYSYRPDVYRPEETVNVQLKGRYPFLRDSYSGDPGFDFALAARKGELARLEAILEAGGDVNVVNDKGRTALMAASGAGNIDIVRMLLSRGANPNIADKEGDTALKEAALSHFADITSAGRPLTVYIGIVKLLIAKGADVNAPKGWPPLICASESGNNEVVKLLLQNGANINAKNVRGMSALSRAIYDGNFDTVKILLANGADIESKDDLGDTPLIIATSRNLELLRNLLDMGANANSTNSHFETALMRAYSVDEVRALLDHGAELDKKDKRGMTSLMYAASRRNLEKVSLLLERGAEVNARNAQGETALAIAKQYSNNQPIIELLQKFGATE
jgi:ankyrin repeat protein